VAVARILIAEPHPEVRQLFVHFVSALGHEPLVYERGVEPVDVDALVVEPALPGAYELVGALRRTTPGLPVIAVSVYPPSELPIGLEWTSFHVKPFGLSTLREALTPHLALAA
jgi:CheY-like chemotaxis protein